MGEEGLTSEERRCLQMWFRQAIAKLELEEVTNEMVRRDGLTAEQAPIHRQQIRRRPAKRNRLPLHGKEVLV